MTDDESPLARVRAKVEERKKWWEKTQIEDEPKNDMILDNVDQAIIDEYEAILAEIDAETRGKEEVKE